MPGTKKGIQLSDLVLSRYTELPYVLQILETRQITLMNPSSWDDKNDSHYVHAYRDRKGHGTVLALCLTGAAQTYHHWKVFTHGASGACIHFDKAKLLKWIKGHDGMIGRNVEYKTLPQVRNSPPSLDDLPFTKRRAYEHEAEFRLLYAVKRKSVPLRKFELPLDTVAAIHLNPWLPFSTVEAVKDVIHRIDGCARLDVLRTTIVKNDDWQRAAEGLDSD